MWFEDIAAYMTTVTVEMMRNGFWGVLYRQMCRCQDAPHLTRITTIMDTAMMRFV